MTEGDSDAKNSVFTSHMMARCVFLGCDGLVNWLCAHDSDIDVSRAYRSLCCFSLSLPLSLFNCLSVGLSVCLSLSLSFSFSRLTNNVTDLQMKESEGM